MKTKYRYGRLYDYCTPNEIDTNARNIIRRSSRIPLGIFSYFVIITYTLLELIGVLNNTAILVIVAMAASGFIYLTRMGPITYLNMILIKKTREKENKTVLEKFCVYHNKDGNYIKIQDKQMLKIKYHPLKWTVVKILFGDKYRNKYVFRISLENIYVKIRFSKVYKEKYFLSRMNKLEMVYKFSLDDLGGICNTKEFMFFVRDKYREIREVINS